MIDDDPVIRTLLRQALNQDGFSVLTAAGGEDGLYVYWQHCATIALVIVDVHMPYPDGVETVAALRQLDPAVRFCFMTGGSTYQEAELLEVGALCLLRKPFSSLTDVAAMVRRLATAAEQED